MIAPALEELSDELGERVTIVKLNIDDNPEAPGKYGVRGIPTMILFKDGQPAATKVGAEPKSRSRPGSKARSRRPAGALGAPAWARESCGSSPMPASIVTCFDSGRLILVAFGAPWCGPCRLLSPGLRALAAMQKDRLTVAKLDIDANPVTADRYRVDSFPDLHPASMRASRPLRLDGYMPLRKIETALQPYPGGEK